MTQAAAIADYLAAGNTLTALEALERFGCMALSQRCGELRQAPHNLPIVSEMITLPNRKRIARYRIAVAYG